MFSFAGCLIWDYTTLVKCYQVSYIVLLNANIMWFNVIMARKIQKRPTKRIRASSNEALVILASLIAQFHIKKLDQTNKLNPFPSDSNGVNNE